MGTFIEELCVHGMKADFSKWKYGCTLRSLEVIAFSYRSSSSSSSSSFSKAFLHLEESDKLFGSKNNYPIMENT